MFAMQVSFYSLSPWAKNRSILQIGSMMLSRTMTSLIASSPETFKMDVHVQLVRSGPYLEHASCLLQTKRTVGFIALYPIDSHKRHRQRRRHHHRRSSKNQRERALTKSYLINSPTSTPTTQPEPCHAQQFSICSSQLKPENPSPPRIQDLEESSSKAEGSIDHVPVSFTTGRRNSIPGNQKQGDTK